MVVHNILHALSALSNNYLANNALSSPTVRPAEVLSSHLRCSYVFVRVRAKIFPSRLWTPPDLSTDRGPKFHGEVICWNGS